MIIHNNYSKSLVDKLVKKDYEHSMYSAGFLEDIIDKGDIFGMTDVW